MSENPFAVSALPGESYTSTPETVTDPPAGRLLRLGAAIIDGILIAIINLPIQFGLGIFQAALNGVTPSTDVLLLSNFLGVIVAVLVNGLMLARCGQSVGKRLLGIQIVDYKTGTLLPMLKVFWIRFYYLLPFAFIAVFLPLAAQQAVNIFVGIIGLIDTLLIFGAEQRCLHDVLAGSKVVMYRADRTRAGA